MRAEELRIGNLILNDLGDPAEVCTLSKNTIETKMGENGWATAFNPQPIPLTSEWLITFGFEQSLAKRNHNIYTLNGVSIFKVNGNWYSTFTERIPLKTVHQFQNFWHALVGSELSIKETV